MLDPLKELNEQQRKVVETTHGPVLVLAGAGSGKTRALTHRLAYLIQQRLARPHQLLAVTFTNKAAAQMRERIKNLMGSSRQTPQAVSTFHGLGARLLREQPAAHTRSAHFIILDSKDSERLVRQALQEQNLSLRDWSPAAMRARISAAKNSLLAPPDVWPAADSGADQILARTFARYEELLGKNDAYDFDDLIVQPVKILQANSTLRRAYQQRWQFISVDEYQDTNPLQDQLLKLLLGPEQNICVVGDDYQAIYSWRGAKVDHILHFESAYPSCQTIYLTQNYRSTPAILQAANEVIAVNTRQKHKELWTKRRSGAAVSLVSVPTDRQEAGWVREQIVGYQQSGGSLRDCVILYRTNAQSRLFEEEFLTHRVPYSIVGGFRFYDRREVKDALAFLHFFANPNSRLSLDRLATALLDRVGSKTLDRWEEQAAQQALNLRQFIIRQAQSRPQLQKLARAYQRVKKLNDWHTIADLLRPLLKHSGYLDWLGSLDDGQERLENIQELLNVASTYTNLDTFLEDTALLSDIDNFEEQQERVTCMTLHAAKGLEFTQVLIVGCEEGLLPHLNSLGDPASLEEERRLLYVGMTRAKQKLTLTCSAQRWHGGEMVPQAPSRFLEQLPATVERSPEWDSKTTDSWSATILPDSPAGEPVLMSVNEGEFITHPQFGRGVVINIQGTKLTCVFGGHGVKTIDHAVINLPF